MSRPAFDWRWEEMKQQILTPRGLQTGTVEGHNKTFSSCCLFYFIDCTVGQLHSFAHENRLDWQHSSRVDAHLSQTAWTSHYRITRFERVCHGGVTKLGFCMCITGSGWALLWNTEWAPTLSVGLDLLNPSVISGESCHTQTVLWKGHRGPKVSGTGWPRSPSWMAYWREAAQEPTAGLPLVNLAACNVLILHIQQHVSSTYSAQDQSIKWVCLIRVLSQPSAKQLKLNTKWRYVMCKIVLI